MNQNLDNNRMDKLLTQIKNCKECEKYLVHGANPIFTASTKSKIIVIGQAPGRIVHNTGIPWNDKSGDNLRTWLGIDKPTFYNSVHFSLMPMGFCYPGTGNAGDLAPRAECAPLWHSRLLTYMREVKLILLIGQYAQAYYLGTRARGSLTDTVRHFEDYLPQYLPLPHPSPRNNVWQAKNQWFGSEVLPVLKEKVKSILEPRP